MNFKPDPDMWKRMAVPFATEEEAEEACAAFLADVKEARERHRIANVYVVAGVRLESTEGDPLDRMMLAQHGDLLRCALMLARAHGTTQEELRQMMSNAVDAARADARRGR